MHDWNQQSNRVHCSMRGDTIFVCFTYGHFFKSGFTSSLRVFFFKSAWIHMYIGSVLKNWFTCPLGVLWRIDSHVHGQSVVRNWLTCSWGVCCEELIHMSMGSLLWGIDSHVHGESVLKNWFLCLLGVCCEELIHNVHGESVLKNWFICPWGICCEELIHMSVGSLLWGIILIHVSNLAYWSPWHRSTCFPLWLISLCDYGYKVSGV